MLAKHEGALNADFQRVYSLRLTEAVAERGIDELWDLVTWLPSGSALSASITADGDQERAFELFGWTRDSEIQLGALKTLQEQVWLFAQAHSDKKIRPFQPIRGPLDKRKTRSVDPRNDVFAVARGLLSQQE